MGEQVTVGKYLGLRLKELGVDSLFGVPGDYAFAVMDEMIATGLRWKGDCNELNAAYAADGYARTHACGIGALVVTFGVGTFSAMSPIVGSFAERIPICLVTGSPPSTSVPSQHHTRVLHHTVGTKEALQMQQKCMTTCTASAVILPHDGTRACEMIDDALLAMIQHSAPVSIEVPKDVASIACPAPTPKDFRALALGRAKRVEASVREADNEAVAVIRRAREQRHRILMIVGHESASVFQQDPSEQTRNDLVTIIDRAQIPFVTLQQSKGIISEDHPLFLGVWNGTSCPQEVIDAVDQSEVLLVFGAWLTDVATDKFRGPGCASKSMCIFAYGSRVIISHHEYRKSPYRGKQLTGAFFYSHVQSLMPAGSTVVVDVGDSGFRMVDFCLPHGATFLCNSLWLAIGYSIPAAFGALVAQPPGVPVFVFCGDGASQMSAQELSPMIREGKHAIVFIINNDDYAIETAIHPSGVIYNSIPMWNYSRLVEVYNGPDGQGRCVRVETEDQCVHALHEALQYPKLTLIEIKLQKGDISPLLATFGRVMGGHK
ncbi:putative 4-hydroxyphenylpyruvate decarboxylase [Paratrimastix pyriformis]|uniref:4-hydroxyphenylpyruvate decarboxylase n=1 Tax=Paratrimastix pyriformis TaxID=342808 RepID=A0ABQ8UHP0_9EUKA|nr:putative 4-hydroxyphenylpyruvate decarboxylase [Paratrimastix pyriformis]